MLPLKNKTVLITRSADQSEDFINKLQDLGANTIALPLIETTATNQHELTTLFNTKKYDWLIFTSTNAVKFFFHNHIIHPYTWLSINLLLIYSCISL